ncbi:MAG: YbaB/EbfC family nucleoid-associated protein [Rhodospirillales bacterium]|nr:YbaB/EbfC family nucleoid-associated protein [Rhodospirillales bacterium]
MKNFASMMKQAQEMQSKMAEMQENLQTIEVIGQSAAGMCQVTLNGKGEAKKIKIDPSLVTPDDAGVLEDLILAAFNDAKGKVEAEMKEKMSELTGGLALPEGFKLPF